MSKIFILIHTNFLESQSNHFNVLLANCILISHKILKYNSNTDVGDKLSFNSICLQKDKHYKISA